MANDAEPFDESQPFPLRVALARPRDFELLTNGPIDGNRSDALLKLARYGFWFCV